MFPYIYLLFIIFTYIIISVYYYYYYFIIIIIITFIIQQDKISTEKIERNGNRSQTYYYCVR